MPAYLVKTNLGRGRTLINGSNAAIVWADNATDAKAWANALTEKDAKGFFDNATLTEISQAFDFGIMECYVTIFDPSANFMPLLSVSAAGATLDTFTLLMNKIVTALNATPTIAGASWSGASNILTVSNPADSIGHMMLKVELKPKAINFPGHNAIPGLVQSYLHLRTPSDSLVANLADPDYVLGRGFLLVRTEL